MGIEVRADLSGFNRLDARMARVPSLIKKAAFDCVALAVTSIQTGPKSGRMYGKHRASAPGEAPATDLGALAASIEAKEESSLSWLVAVGARYGAILEFRLNRPFLLPAFDKVKRSFLLAIEALFND